MVVFAKFCFVENYPVKLSKLTIHVLLFLGGCYLHPSSQAKVFPEDPDPSGSRAREEVLWTSRCVCC